MDPDQLSRQPLSGSCRRSSKTVMRTWGELSEPSGTQNFNIHKGLIDTAGCGAGGPWEPCWSRSSDLGKVGIDDNDDVVEGVILLQRGYKALSCLILSG